MQITTKELNPCHLSVHCVADAEEILNKRAEVLNTFKKAPARGFRPGKASIEAIKIQYRDQIEDALKRSLAETSYHEAIFEHKLKPHGQPRFNSYILTGGQFTCDFELFVKPDFELAPYRNFEIPKPHEPQKVDELAELLMQDLRVRFGDVSPYTETDFVQTGDNIIIDYEGFIDGQRTDNLCATGEMLTVGKSHIPALDDNMLGMSLGETREFDFTVPEAALPSLSGKLIHLKVTLNMGSKTVPCPLDDNLAQKVGKQTLNELKEVVYATAGARIQQAFRAALNEAVANRLIVSNQIKIPSWMALSEAQYLVQAAKLNWNALVDQDKEKYLQMAEKNVALSLILDKIRENEPEAQLSDQEVFEIVKKNLAGTQLQTSLEETIANMQKSGYLQVLFTKIRDEYSLDFIVKTVRVIE